MSQRKAHNSCLFSISPERDSKSWLVVIAITLKHVNVQCISTCSNGLNVSSQFSILYLIVYSFMQLPFIESSRKQFKYTVMYRGSRTGRLPQAILVKAQTSLAKRMRTLASVGEKKRICRKYQKNCGWQAK